MSNIDRYHFKIFYGGNPPGANERKNLRNFLLLLFKMYEKKGKIIKKAKISAL